jgi:PiT family inorganic phosphate transporter
MDGLHPVGVWGTLIALLVSPPIGFAGGWLLVVILRRASRRWSNRWRGPVISGEWAAAAGLSYSHGANDAQKAMGVIAALLLGAGVTDDLTVPLWVKVTTGLTLTLGTAAGGWRIVKTVGRRIYDIKPLDSLASQSSSTGVIFTASILGAPVSTTQIVASSVIGCGGGRRRWRHVRWQVVKEMGIAWITTIPAAGLLAVLYLFLAKGVAAL